MSELLRKRAERSNIRLIPIPRVYRGIPLWERELDEMYETIPHEVDQSMITKWLRSLLPNEAPSKDLVTPWGEVLVEGGVTKDRQNSLKDVKQRDLYVISGVPPVLMVRRRDGHLLHHDELQHIVEVVQETYPDGMSHSWDVAVLPGGHRAKATLIPDFEEVVRDRVFNEIFDVEYEDTVNMVDTTERDLDSWISAGYDLSGRIPWVMTKKDMTAISAEEMEMLQVFLREQSPQNLLLELRPVNPFTVEVDLSFS